ncbi:MAG: hypothetical protein U0T32_10355 [Chitinophagales bacterium]
MLSPYYSKMIWACPAKKPGRAFRCNLFAPQQAPQKRVSAAITHAHCGALEIICAIARILRAISTFAYGKHLKDAGGLLGTHSLEASNGGGPVITPITGEKIACYESPYFQVNIRDS